MAAMTPEMLAMTAPDDHMVEPENDGWDSGEEPCAFCMGTGTVQIAVDEVDACLGCNGTGFPLSDPWGYEIDWPNCGF